MMGKNYYWYTDKVEPCETCGHVEEEQPVHIGKSSAGWKFLFHTPDSTIRSFNNWMDIFEDDRGHIEDEYGSIIPHHEFTYMVGLKFSDGKDQPIYEEGFVDANGHPFSAREFT